MSGLSTEWGPFPSMGKERYEDSTSSEASGKPARGPVATPLTDAMQDEIEGGRFVTWLQVLPAFWRVFRQMRQLEAERADLLEALETILNAIDGNRLTVGDCFQGRAALSRTKEGAAKLKQDDRCPKCGKGFMEKHSHRFSTERGPNVPDADWLECCECGFSTDPE